MIGLLLAAAAALVKYDCVLDTPEEFKRENGRVETRVIHFSQFQNKSDWKFEIELQKSGSLTAFVKWPSNPMQLAGKYPALVTGEGAFAFAAYSAGPCLFTERMCMSLVHVVDQPDNSADVIISPSAMAANREKAMRYPFIVIAQGKCAKTGAGK